MGLRDRLSGALSAARSATADIARSAAGATRSAVLSAVGRAETAIQTAARAAGVSRASEPVRAQAPPSSTVDKGGASSSTPRSSPGKASAAPSRAETPARPAPAPQAPKDSRGGPSAPSPAAEPTKGGGAGGSGGGSGGGGGTPPTGPTSTGPTSTVKAPGGERGGKVFGIVGGVVTSGSNDRALSDYAAAAAAFADKLQRSSLNGATPLAVAVDAKGNEVSIPADVFLAGASAVADYLKEKIDAGKIGDKVNIRAKKFVTTDDYLYEPPDDDADHYGTVST